MDYAQLDDGELRFIFLNPNDANYVPAAKTRSR
jgi:iron-sulfur cluster assembly protein